MRAESDTQKFLGRAVTAGLVMTLAGCGGSSGGDAGSVDFALSGIIDIESGTRVDSDSADALALTGVPRDSAQLLPQEYILAGYVSQSAGTYPAISGLADARYFADPDDEFSMRLLSGQAVYLQTFATRAGISSLKLSLLDGNGVIASASTTSQSSQVSVSLPDTAADGTYSVRVEAVGITPMLYVLSTSVAGSVNGLSFRWPDYDFVEGEAIVAFRKGSRGPSAQSLNALNNAELKQEVAPGLWRVKSTVQSALEQQPGGPATLDWIQELKREPDVLSATPNYRVQAMATPIDEPFYPEQQWHYGLLNAPTAWQFATDGGAGVTVAVMDTGLFSGPDGWHGDILANVPAPLPAGADFVSAAFDNDGVPGPDDDPTDPGNAVGSSVYHGTHVSGTVSAVVNDSGGAGVAYQSTLLPVRVLGEGGSGSSSDLLQALQWVAGPENGAPLADVVNLSLGGLPYIQSLQDAINVATSRGVIFVAAAGNSATDVPSYPAAFSNVFAVSAVDGAGELSSYSNFGAWIDVAAPGGDASRDGNGDGRGDLVVSTSASIIDGVLRETYIGLQGTSMAAPHVSAVVALMKNLDPSLNYAAINASLMAGDLTVATCASEPCPKTTRLGWGLMDAGKSVLAASSGVVPDILTATPAIVTLSSESALSATVTLEVYGSASSVTIDSVSAPPDWLSFDAVPMAGDTGTDFEIAMTLDPDALEPGVSERATLTVEYTSDQPRTLEIPVVGQQVTDEQARNAGRHFVLLVEPDPEGDFYDTVAQVSVVAEGGQYSFAFVPDDGVEPRSLNEVPPGKYILVAGTDLDNDGLICHAGEACAEYPVAGLREEILIEAGQSVQGIRMTTSYARPSISATSPDQLPRPDFRGYRLLSAEPGTTNQKAIAQP
ncbi:hypothetical protein BKP64_01805 [Marinobacter salinus]|uniref:Peptidase S8/S53 domain-containing protein n=1 Tax=Marinobacter salinus TaxID=1874317 RepID=A0A1D9GHL1_9GAMM|nr:S8 family serine peptidase [Marinobacter salinus]AOY87014.1 hypothetical protein BKP64_01805 [Marinobacter salinus]